MTMQNGVGAVRMGFRKPRQIPPVHIRGVGALIPIRPGLGIPGPFGDNPAQAPSKGPYEISGTQVYLRENPGTSSAIVSGAESGINGEYGQNNNIVAGTPAQVDFDGTTGVASGLLWAHVTVKSGALAGKSGYVAVKFLAPVGWTASHGGTGPIPSGGPAPELPPEEAAVKKTNYIPWVIGGLAVAGLVVGGAIMAKKRRGRSPIRTPAVALEARRRRRRYR